MTHNRPPYAIDSVDNALRALQMLRDEGVVRVSDVADRLGVAVSSAHRILSMLVYRGFALQDDAKRYIAGPALRAPVLVSGETKTMIELARPILSQLCEDLGETVNLTSRVGAHARVLLTVETTSLLRIGDRTGSVLPAQASAGGRALLAAEPMDLIERLYRGKSDAYGPALSDADYDGLLRELAVTRRRGYGLCDEEAEIGVTALAVPIIAKGGRVRTTICVSIPSSRSESLQNDPGRLDLIFAAQRRLRAVLDAALDVT